jgi:hypothetical protein
MKLDCSLEHNRSRSCPDSGQQKQRLYSPIGIVWLGGPSGRNVSLLLAASSILFSAMYIITVSALYVEEWGHEKGGSSEGRKIIIQPGAERKSMMRE